VDRDRDSEEVGGLSDHDGNTEGDNDERSAIDAATQPAYTHYVGTNPRAVSTQ
jgi:hypothetical protein